MTLPNGCPLFNVNYMYSTLLVLHSFVRWLVVLSLLVALVRGYQGWFRADVFRKTDYRLRHLTATFAHIQLMIGFLLYFQSPLVAIFRSTDSQSEVPLDIPFFGWMHISLMTLAIVVITVGSALAKRQPSDLAKFRTMAIWFSIGLLIICIAIPWPFSPLINRPYLRSF